MKWNATYSGGLTICGSTYFNHGLAKASSAEQRLPGSNSNILSIKSKAVFGKLQYIICMHMTNSTGGHILTAQALTRALFFVHWPAFQPYILYVTRKWSDQANEKIWHKFLLNKPIPAVSFTVCAVYLSYTQLPTSSHEHFDTLQVHD